jgi:hypothetical protein
VRSRYHFLEQRSPGYLILVLLLDKVHIIIISKFISCPGPPSVDNSKSDFHSQPQASVQSDEVFKIDVPEVEPVTKRERPKVLNFGNSFCTVLLEQ